MEIEAKYTVLDPQAFTLLQELRHLGPYQLIDSRKHSFRDTYLDTADDRLLKAGYACRWRITDDSQRITVKGLAQGLATAHQREEFEARFHRVDPTQPLSWGDTPPHDLVTGLVGDLSLRPFLALQQTRTTRLLLDPQGEPLAELALDRFIVEKDPDQRAFLEVEIELIGSLGIGRLTPIQQALSQIAGLSWQPTSKFERAVFIAIPSSSTARTLGLWGITPHQPTDEARRRAMRPLFLQMLIAEPTAYAGDNDGAQPWLESIQGLKTLSAEVTAQAKDPLESAAGRALEHAVQEAETLRAIEHFKEIACNPADSPVRASDLLSLHQVWKIAYRHHLEELRRFLTSPAYVEFKRTAWIWLNQPLQVLPHAPQIQTSLARWLFDETTHCTTEGETSLLSPQPRSTDYRSLRHTVLRLRHMLAAFHEILDSDLSSSILSNLIELESALTALEAIAENLPHLQALRKYGTWSLSGQGSDIPVRQAFQGNPWARLLPSYTACYQALYSATRDLWYAYWHHGARPLLQRLHHTL